MSLFDWVENALARSERASNDHRSYFERWADEDRERRLRGIFQYWLPLRPPITLAVIGLLLIGFSIWATWTPEGPTTTLVRIGTAGLGVYSVIFAVRRYRSPIRFVLTNDSLRALFVGGREATWQIHELGVEPRTRSQAWEGCVAVRDVSRDERAFLVFRDLPGWEQLVKALRK